MNFEESTKRLEEIANLLEKGTTNLEESLELFEEGSKLSLDCYKILKKAEQRVKIIKANSENV